MTFTELQIETSTQAPVSRKGATRYPARPLSETFRSARSMAREWAEGLDERRRLPIIRAFMSKVIIRYIEQLGLGSATTAPPEFTSAALDSGIWSLATTIGGSAADLDSVTASYWLSVTYTAMLPPSFRSRLGVYYTPPALSARLLDMASDAGINWKTCRVLDPACGGGAFLGPAALRMVHALRGRSPEAVLSSIASRLRGLEIDPFAAWLSQTFLAIALAEITKAAGTQLPSLVRVCDSLDQAPGNESFDLVIGNPPYGRVTLTAALRERYKRSLYGHANLYGVFTDLALRWAAPRGIIAYVTPTSFLAGEYFKALRALLASEAPPVSVDFVEARKGVFEDVLQETMLATYRRGGAAEKASVHHVVVSPKGNAETSFTGDFNLPEADPSSPWLMPRQPEHAPLVERLARMKSRLADWGYGVSTGPLVWNRHKAQLRSIPGKDTLPLVWAEAIAGPGRFIFRAEKKNHEPYFRLTAGDDWLKIDKPCVLVQRTTAKEQARRLIAAALPKKMIVEHGGVVVENHLNMIRPLNGKPHVSPSAVAAVLNSEIVDLAFRCISGSVAVSAFELEALPLPSVLEMRTIENLLAHQATLKTIEHHLRAIYLGEGRS
jgi:adenine-specific DNA-methyltransferase